MPVVTLINARRVDAATALAAEFRKGLSQSRFPEGKDVVVEYHWRTVLPQSSTMPSGAVSR
jgi:hypothetical protein